MPSSRSAIDAELAELRTLQRRLFADLAAGQQRFRRLARSVLAVQEQERRRVARELHDGLGQNLTVLQHEIEGFAAAFRSDPVMGPRSDRALALCRGILHDTRQLSRLLRPQILDDLGLVPALNWLVRSSAEPGGFEGVLHVEPELPKLGEELDTVLFRVAQEALNNITRHARASHVTLRLHTREGHVYLLVLDDGVGCDPAQAFAGATQGETTGLAAMRERAQLFGGELSLQSAPGTGTQLRVRLPLGEGEAPP